LVKISLDTNEENISREIRGAGIAEKAQNTFALLYSRKCNVKILATVTSKTKQNLNTFSENFNKQVQFQPLYQNLGRAKYNENLSISGFQYYKALTEESMFGLLHNFYDNIHQYKNNPYKRCAMAIEEISIDANGNVYPCHMLHFEKYLCGNLNKEEISAIYKYSTVIKELQMINVDNISKCKKCIYRNFCGGSCRARVNITKDGIKGSDDFCIFEQNAILNALLYSYG
jgi:radical SAM protein with 4Fe4S-binding SPASM domain